MSHLLTCDAITRQFEMNTVQFATDRFMHLETGSQLLNDIGKVAGFDASCRRLGTMQDEIT